MVLNDLENEILAKIIQHNSKDLIISCKGVDGERYRLYRVVNNSYSPDFFYQLEKTESN